MESLKQHDVLSEVSEVKAKVIKQRKDVKQLRERLKFISSEKKNTETLITKADQEDQDLEVVENELVVRMIHAAFEQEATLLANRRLQQTVTRNRQLNSKNTKILRQNKGRYKERDTANLYRETEQAGQALQLQKLEDDIAAAEDELESRRTNLNQLETRTEKKKAVLRELQQDAVEAMQIITDTLGQVKTQLRVDGVSSTSPRR